MTKNNTEESNADASPIAPDDPNTFPSMAAESPNAVRVDASPAAYKTDLVTTSLFTSPLAASPAFASDPPRYVTVRGSSDIEHGENAVRSPAP